MAVPESRGSDDLFRELDAYPWETDNEFQGGLRAILGSVNDPSQIEHLTLRAKCYYYARKAGRSVNFDGYKRWVESQGQDTTIRQTTSEGLNEETNANDAGGYGIADAPKPASFAEICDMIAEGKPIPGIKDIPDTILAGQASEASTSPRKKPWERTPSDAPATPTWMT